MEIEYVLQKTKYVFPVVDNYTSTHDSYGVVYFKSKSSFHEDLNHTVFVSSQC